MLSLIDFDKSHTLTAGRGSLSICGIAISKAQCKVNTKSNFKNLNGKWLNVTEIVGKRVSCKVDGVTMDFDLKEVVEFSHI
jgi:hypothetical protein